MILRTLLLPKEFLPKLKCNPFIARFPYSNNFTDIPLSNDKVQIPWWLPKPFILKQGLLILNPYGFL